MSKKLKLTYIREKGGVCIEHPHYDLHTDETEPENVACILINPKNVKILKKMVELYNKYLEGATK